MSKAAWLETVVDHLEKATRPDRSLDWEIHLRDGIDGVGMYGRHPEYTRSIDAARTLVPNGDAWTLGQNIHHRHWVASVNEFKPNQTIGSRGEGAHPSSPAIALCIAALKATTT